MQIKNVGTRGTLFTFNDLGIPTNVYVIHANKFIYIIDTYLGPESMELVNQYIKENYPNKSWVIINSHSHWDHVWGNNLYRNSLIVAHQKCKELMQRDGLSELERFKEYTRGEVILTYPNLTFTDQLLFEEDKVLIYHTPGHTVDEISVLDLEDKVLFAGDNLERPIPFTMANDLLQYISTLEEYLKVNAEIIIGGHTGIESKELIVHNLHYLKNLVTGDTAEYETGEYADYHKANVEWLKNHK